MWKHFGSTFMEALKHSSSMPVNPANSWGWGVGRSPVRAHVVVNFFFFFVVNYCGVNIPIWQISSYQWLIISSQNSWIFNNWLLWAGCHDDYPLLSWYLLSHNKGIKFLLCLHLLLNTLLFINLIFYPFMFGRKNTFVSKASLCWPSHFSQVLTPFIFLIFPSSWLLQIQLNIINI